MFWGPQTLKGSGVGVKSCHSDLWHIYLVKIYVQMRICFAIWTVPIWIRIFLNMVSLNNPITESVTLTQLPSPWLTKIVMSGQFFYIDIPNKALVQRSSRSNGKYQKLTIPAMEDHCFWVLKNLKILNLIGCVIYLHTSFIKAKENISFLIQDRV